MTDETSPLAVLDWLADRLREVPSRNGQELDPGAGPDVIDRDAVWKMLGDAVLVFGRNQGA